MHHLEPARAGRFADDDLGDVVGAGIGDEFVGDVAPGDRNRRCTQALGQPQMVGDAVALDIAEPLGARGLDIDRGPRHAQAIGDPPCIANQPRRARRLADADQHPLTGRPRAGNRMLAHMRQQLLVDALGGAAQRQLAQRRQIAGREKVANRALGLLRHIDLALVQALDQILGREVDDFDVVGLVEHAVGHGLAHADSGDPGDHVVEALDMLDVQRREHVDAGGDQLLDIEIALGMAAARSIGVRQFIDKNELRAALQDRVEIHFGQEVALVLDLLPRNRLETVEQRLGLAPAMRLDDADDDIRTLAQLGLRRSAASHRSCRPRARRRERSSAGRGLRASPPPAAPPGTVFPHARTSVQSSAFRGHQ